MATISLEGREDSLVKLLQSLGVGGSDQDRGVWGDDGIKWRQGTRTWHGWLHGRDSYPLCLICPATVIWSAEGRLVNTEAEQHRRELPKRTIFIRVHPSAFNQLWTLLMQLSKVQKPSVRIHNLRHEIGSIEVTGPNSTESLVKILRPFQAINDNPEEKVTPEKVWDSLIELTNPSFLPRNILIAFECLDPRLRHTRLAECIKPDAKEILKVIDVCSNWPLDETSGPISLFDQKLRTKSIASMPSEKVINRKRDGKESSKMITSKNSFPLVLFPTWQARRIQSSWVLLLPWSHVKCVWQSLMHCSLSSSSSVQFGGIIEAHQAAYESGTPWFPADYPGTDAGFQWELEERRKLESEWKRKPKGRRVEYEALDLGAGRKGEIGRGWACDWERLISANLGTLLSQ
jgi:ribonuclease P/MRP protein subunit POP1